MARRKLLKDLNDQISASKDKLGKDQQALEASKHRVTAQERKLMELKRATAAEKNKLAEYEKEIQPSLEAIERMKQEQTILLERVSTDACLLQVESMNSANQGLEGQKRHAMEGIRVMEAEIAATTSQLDGLKKKAFGTIPEELFNLSSEEAKARVRDTEEEMQTLSARDKELKQKEGELQAMVSELEVYSQGARANPLDTPHDHPRYVMALMMENAALLAEIDDLKEEKLKQDLEVSKLEGAASRSTADLAARKLKNDVIGGQLAELKQEYNDMSRRVRNIEMLAQAEAEVSDLFKTKMRLAQQTAKLEAQLQQFQMHDQQRQAYKEWKHEWNEPAQDVKTKDQMEQDWAEKYR